MEILNIIVRVAAEILFVIWLMMQAVYIYELHMYRDASEKIDKKLLEMKVTLNKKLEEMKNEG